MMYMKLPTISGRELIKLLEKRGFKIVGHKGSHVRIKKITSEKILISVVPLCKSLAPGTLLAILKQCDLEREDLFKKH